MPTSQYDIPRFGTPEGSLHGWLIEAVQEGDAWLKTQPPVQSWEALLPLMDGPTASTAATTMSNVSYPMSKRIAKELIASLASFRYDGEITTQWDNTLYDQAHILTQLDRHWYRTTFANAAHRAALQNGVVLGTGYWIQEWDKHYWGPNRGDIRLSSLSPQDVTFIQMPKDHDIQRAYAVIVRYELPINLAKRIYSYNQGFANALSPDRDAPNWLQKGLQKLSQFVSPALRVAGRSRQANDASFPTVDVFHMYTLDGAINEGYEDIKMAPQGANWSYTVPYVGSPLETGMVNPATGEQWTKPAQPSDCLLFPLRRLTIFSNTGIAYDGSSPWWHGDVPVTRVWYNDWPWRSLGGSCISDGISLEQSNTALLRGLEDAHAARLDPPAIYDDRLVSKTWAEAFNTRMAGTRAAADLQAGDPIKFPVDPRQYDVGPGIPDHINRNEERMKYLSAVQDLAAVVKARQIPSADTVEKLLEMAGPIMQDMVRAIEQPLTQLGNWRIAYYFQFYSTARVVQLTGMDDFDPKQWQMFQPERIKQIQDRNAFQFTPDQILGPTQDLSAAQQTALAKRRIGDFRYDVTESGVNELNRMTTKLFYLQLMKEGFPISWWTLAKIARIPNFGPPPEGTNTEMERWIAQQQMQMELAADLQAEAQQRMMEMAAASGQLPDASMMGGGGGEGGMTGRLPVGPGQGNGGGRSNSYKKPPRLVQKDGGTRTSVVTS